MEDADDTFIEECFAPTFSETLSLSFSSAPSVWMKQLPVRLAILNDGVNGRFPHCRLFRRIIVVVEAALLVLVPVEHGSLLCLAGLAIPRRCPPRSDRPC